MQIQNNTEGRTFTDPDTMLQSIAGAEEISAVFPCKLSQFTQKESFAKYSVLSILVIIGFIGFMVLMNMLTALPNFLHHIIIIICIIVFVATYGRRWLAGYRSRPDALIITSSRLLLVRGVTFKKPQRIYTYEESLEIPTHKSKLKCRSQELIITTSDGFEVGVRQSGFVYTPNSVSTKYYKNKVVSLKAMTALLKDL